MGPIRKVWIVILKEHRRYTSIWNYKFSFLDLLDLTSVRGNSGSVENKKRTARRDALMVLIGMLKPWLKFYKHVVNEKL